MSARTQRPTPRHVGVGRRLAYGLTSALAALALGVMARPVQAAPAPHPHISLLYTAAPSFLAAYVAQDHGFFTQHGLDVTLTTAGNSATIPAALVGGSSQIAGIQAVLVVQAAAAGLDVAAIAGTEAYPAPYHQGILARVGSGITSLKQMAGKRMGVPGIGATMDILARQMFIDAGDTNMHIVRVEVPFARMVDALRAGDVDAVLAVDPTYTRITAAKVGVPVASWQGLIPKGTFLSLYASTKSWAAKNPATLADFRAAIDEATRFIDNPANETAVRASLAHWTHLPAPVVKMIELPRSLTTKVTAQSLQFWVQVAEQQHLITKKVSAEQLIVK